MSTVTTPRFTAAASLYQTSGHYRTGAVDPPRHTAGTMRLSTIDVPGEVIEIEDDAPWSPPSWGGHTGPGPTGGAADDTGSGGGGGGSAEESSKDPNDKPLPGLHGCSANQIQSEAARPCELLVESDLMNGVKNRHFTKCTGTKRGNVVHPKMECCQKRGKRTVCDELQ